MQFDVPGVKPVKAGARLKTQCVQYPIEKEAEPMPGDCSSILNPYPNAEGVSETEGVQHTTHKEAEAMARCGCCSIERLSRQGLASRLNVYVTRPTRKLSPCPVIAIDAAKANPALARGLSRMGLA